MRNKGNVYSNNILINREPRDEYYLRACEITNTKLRRLV